MSELHFNTLQDALQHANDRIDVALARTIQLEAITDAHHALLSAVAATHPDPIALREEWRRISSLIVASSQIRPPYDAAMEIRAEQTQAMRAAFHEKPDQSQLAVQIEAAVLVEGRVDNGEDAREIRHAVPLKVVRQRATTATAVPMAASRTAHSAS